ncbi:RUN and SH3 domain-containing protein 1 isoform X2 [Protopterus annectens]|uniref:RUN and SH3 domain-containing protein 1 isoform X2 n=1 Tax=Protopterus annectens TaxID=7888 RepID=UPI001CFB31A0|nr:RUN and SH3 domain-containing protein 1 isoform X2 [Protopterus annectens]
MLAPEKCILKNLNTVHLRNISASLRTLNHNNESNANGKSAQKETWEKELCSLCLHKNCIPSEVDANFNNPSFPCMCCQLHPPQLEKLPAQPLARNTVSTTNVESLSPTTLLSPSQFTASPTSSSSISSCSDFDSDSSPNSTCSKEFPSEDQDEEATSPLSQPTIVPLEEHDFRSDTNEQKKHDILSHRECHQPKSESSLYSVTLSASEANTPDILCQSNYSTSNTPSKVSAINSETDNKTATSAVELLNNQHIPRFTPLHKNSENLDSEQNGTQVSTRQPSAAAGNLGHILINGETQAPTHCTQHNQPLILSMGKKTPDLVNKNSANCSEHAIASPHDLPDSTISSAPNTQINVIFDSLNTHHFCLDNEKQRSNINEPSKKTVTSFHELAQKRKKSTLGQQIQGRNDKSDWLIVFSPDTELPPASELSQAAFEQKQMRAAPESDEDRRGPNVTTFKELRYKNALTKQNSQQSHNYSLSAPAEFCGRSGTNLQQLVEDRQYELVKDHYHPLNEEAEGKPSLTDYGSSGNDSGIGSPEEDLLPQLKGHIVTYFEHMPRRKKSSSTLQPIEEWPVNELSDGELKKEYALNKRKGVQGEETLRFTGRSTYLEEYQVRGKADGGDKGSKHGLLNAVSSSVDKLVSYFSTTRNLVQKAQLGDSRISPEVGHLVLFGLNPALLAVLKDGLKPYQNDVIVGRRKNSVWRMVEASVKPGPETIAFYSLYCKICKLPQLKTSRMRFNAFIFGLLNLKLLEFWFSHLRQCTDILSMHYEPKAFLSLSNTSLKHLFDELLLLLQPLSILTFNLHILFEHCHHFVEDAEQLNNHTVFKQTEKRLSVLHANKRRENTSSSNQYPRGLTTELKTLSHMQRGTNKPDSENIIDECAEKSECYGKLPSQRNVCVEEGLVCSTSRSLTENRKQSVEQSQNAVGETLQHTFEQVVQWGDRLAQNLVKFKEQHNGPANVPQVQVKSEEKSSRVSNVNEMATERKPVNWWEQLSQTSRVYISPSKEGSFLAKWLKPKTPDAVHNSIFSSSKQNESFRSEPLVILRVQNTKEHTMEIKKDESVPAENSINNNYSECSVAVQKKEPKTNDTGVLQNTDKPSDDSASENRGTGEGAVKRDDVDNECHYTKPEKNCSPPSVQCDVRNLDNSYAFNKLENTRTEMLPSIGSTMWMGRIFGATSPSNRTSQDEQGANQLKSRRPSSWLAPNLNVFGQARKGTITERVMPPLVLEEADTVSSDEETKPQRAVKALCSHTGQGEHELSFEKGDILKVVSNVDENWIRCCHGDKIGIVPVEYTSLIL